MDRRLTGHGRLLALCCLVTFGGYLAASLRLPVMPLYAQSLGLAAAPIGRINAAFFLMAGLGAFPLGMLADRVGGKPVALAGLALLAAASLLLGFSTTYPALAGTYLLFGLGMAAFGPTMMALVAAISPRSHLGRSYGWYTTALFCGMSLGPALGGFLARHWGFRTAFLAGGALVLAAAAAFLGLLPADAFRRAPHTAEGTALRRLTRVLANRPLLACWAVTLGACFGLGMFTSFIPLHAGGRGLDVGRIGLVFFSQGLSNGLARIPFGSLSDRAGQRGRLVTAGVLVLVLSLAGCGAARSFGGFLLGALGVGLGMALAFTSVGALIAEAVPAASRGLAMGGYNTAIYFGMLASAAGMGPVSEASGFAAAFYLAAGVVGASLLLFVPLMRGFTPPGVEAAAAPQGSGGEAPAGERAEG